MYILGINAFHADSSACLLKDGVVICASEEERFRRIKHWAGFPSEAIKFCLTEAKISVEDLDYITISRNPRANVSKKIIHTIKNRVEIKSVLDRLLNTKRVASVKSELANLFRVKESDIKNRSPEMKNTSFESLLKLAMNYLDNKNSNLDQ